MKKQQNKKGSIVITDTSLPLPFKDSSQKSVIIDGRLNLVEDYLAFMDDVYRILKSGGVVTISVPYWTSFKAFVHPMMRHVFNESLFHILTKKSRKDMIGENKYVCDFEGKSINHILTEEYAGKSQDAISFALTHYNNVASDIIITLMKK